VLLPLLPSDTHRKSVTFIAAVLLPFVTCLVSLLRIYVTLSIYIRVFMSCVERDVLIIAVSTTILDVCWNSWFFLCTPRLMT
jgi:hypothetical protein